MAYLLGIDLGTTGTRAYLFNEKLEVKSYAYEPLSIQSRDNIAEQNPLELWRKTLRAIRRCVFQSRVSPTSIAACGIANQRETVIAWDEKGKPLYNAISWRDKRTAAQCEELKKFEKTVKNKTGLMVSPYFSASKISWLLKRLKTRKAKIGTPDSWLLWNLTKIHATDYTNASRTLLFNINTLQFDDELRELFGIPASVLPTALPSVGRYGDMDKKILGAAIPIYAVAGDQQSALAGQGCFSPGSGKITYGTGCFLLVNTGKKILANNLATTLTAGIKPRYCLEASVFTGGALFDYLQKLGLIASPQQLEQLAANAAPSNVVIIPALNGLGAPDWKDDCRAAITGLTQSTQAKHIARAALEAVAFSVKHAFDALPLKPKTLKVDGGASQNDLLLQIQADVLKTKLARPRNVDTTSLGIAFLAGLGAGIYKKESDVNKLLKKDRSFSQKNNVDYKYHEWLKALNRQKAAFER